MKHTKATLAFILTQVYRRHNDYFWSASVRDTRNKRKNTILGLHLLMHYRAQNSKLIGFWIYCTAYYLWRSHT